MCCMACWTARQVPLCAVSASRRVPVSCFFFARTHNVKCVRTSGIGRVSTRSTGTPLRYGECHRAVPDGERADRDWSVLFGLGSRDSDGQSDSWQTVGDMPPTEDLTCTDEHVLHHPVIPSVQFTLESNSVSTVDDLHDSAHWKWFDSPGVTLVQRCIGPSGRRSIRSLFAQVAILLKCSLWQSVHVSHSVRFGFFLGLSALLACHPWASPGASGMHTSHPVPEWARRVVQITGCCTTSATGIPQEEYTERLKQPEETNYGLK